MTAPSATLGDIPRLSWLILIPFVTRMFFPLNGVFVSMQSLLHGHPRALGTGPRTVLDTCNHAL